MFTVVLTDEEMALLRASLNIRVIQRPRYPGDPVTALSDRVNQIKPDREEANAPL